MHSRSRLVDVAKKAGVDIATASRALARGKGWERLSDACVDRVEEAARTLDYRPNALARRLRTNRADAVGLLIPRLNTAYTRELFSGFEGAIRDAGFHAVLITGKDPIETALQYQSEGRIDGIMAPVFAMGAADRHRLVESEVPCVFTHAPIDAHYGPAVAVDAARGISEVVKHLAETGHRQLLWAGLRRAGTDNEHRALAFRKTCQQVGIVALEMAVKNGGTSLSRQIQAARDAVLPFLQCAEAPDGIVCYHDPIALGAMTAARLAGLEIPKRLSVVGFDDSFGEVADPPLSSISPRPNKMAHEAMKILTDILQNRNSNEFQGVPIVIKPRLVMRASTRTHG